MPERSQEVYQTIGWIDKQKDIHTFLIMDFQLAVQDAQDLSGLNFSRDMLSGLGKNLIFVTSPYGDDMLATGAYDFYSFLKIRVVWSPDDMSEGLQGMETLADDVRCDQEYAGDSEQLRQQLDRAGDLVRRAKKKLKSAEYDESIRLLLRAKSIREQILGEEHIETAAVYLHLASTYRKTGVYETAEKFCLKAAQIYAQGKYTEAEELIKEALHIWESVPDEKSQAVAAFYNNLATIYSRQEKYDKAETLYQTVLKIREKTFGENHPDLATSFNNLGAIYREREEYDKAEDFYRKSMTIFRKIYGDDNLKTILAHYRLACIYKLEEKWDKAEEAFEDILGQMELVLGVEHPKTADCYADLADVYRYMGKETEAENLYKKALSVYENTLGNDHPKVDRIREKLRLE